MQRTDASVSCLAQGTVLVLVKMVTAWSSGTCAASSIRSQRADLPELSGSRQISKDLQPHALARKVSKLAYYRLCTERLS